MYNWIPYAVLSLFSFVLLVVAWRKVRTLRYLPFYASLAGMIYLFEYVIMVIFQSYKYKVGLLQDTYFDNVLGPIWILVIASMFMGTEWLFVRCGWYEQYWWRTPYTGISLLGFFAFAKWLWRRIATVQVSTGSLRFLLLYCAGISLHGSSDYAVAVQGLYRFHAGVFEGATRDHVLIDTLHAFVATLFLAIVAVTKTHWSIRLLLLAVMSAGYWLASRYELLSLFSPWLYLILFGIDALVLLVLLWFNRILLRGTTPATL
jgi:hypothetical protein